MKNEKDSSKTFEDWGGRNGFIYILLRKTKWFDSHGANEIWKEMKICFFLEQKLKNKGVRYEENEVSPSLPVIPPMMQK